VIEVSGTTNNIEFYSRYNRIDKWEILDKEKNITYSGTTSWPGTNGYIQMTGFTFSFEDDKLYTFKAYFLYENVYYLSYHGLLRSFSDNSRLNDNYIKMEKEYTFKNK